MSREYRKSRRMTREGWTSDRVNIEDLGKPPLKEKLVMASLNSYTKTLELSVNLSNSYE